MSVRAATVRRAMRWHPPLMLVAVASLAVFVASVVGLVVDDRMLVGEPIWLKPAKFGISIAVYGVTLAWLLSLLRRWRRAGRVLGTVIAVMAAGELAVIVLQVVRGQRSHFNFATPFDAVVFEAMAGMIVALWLANLVAAVLFLAQRLGERSISWAIRTSTLISLAGMAVAFFMPRPTPAQQAAMASGRDVGVIGAHTVGAPDGSPGLPLTGWSTVGGDLRVPHFVGIHGLQALILLAMLLAALGGRYALLRSDAVRTRVVLIASGGYAGLLVLVTWQALRGQSVVHPDAVTVTVAAALALATAAALAAVLRRAARPAATAPDGPPPAEVRAQQVAP